jgi:hypothetical protein
LSLSCLPFESAAIRLRSTLHFPRSYTACSYCARGARSR